jgi:hypothetical protein
MSKMTNEPSLFIKKKNEHSSSYSKEEHIGRIYSKISSRFFNMKINITKTRDDIDMDIYVFTDDGWKRFALFEKDDIESLRLSDTSKIISYAVEFMEHTYVFE